MKKSLCLCVICALLFGVIPAVVHADFVAINSVTIKDLDYPVVGQSFDYNFSTPDVYTCYYEKDVSKYDKGIVWYDLGLDGSWMHEMDASDVPQTGHSYMAEIYLQNAGSSEMAEFNYTHGRFDLNHVTVNVSCYPELKVIGTNSVITSDTKMKAQITFKASSVFDAAHGVIIDLDSFPNAGDTPLSHVPTSIQAPDFFTMRAEWFLKGQNYSSVSPLADDYKFKAGEEYNLRVILDCGPEGIFSSDAYVTIAKLIPDNVSADVNTLVADIAFAVPITIEGIREPHYGEAPQTEGFTSNANVDVFGNWFYDTGAEFPEPYTGETFVMGHVYYLQLSVSSREGKSLGYLTEDMVEVNLGKIYSFTVNGDNIVLSIQFAIEPGETVLGDVNGDGKINAKDVTTLMKYLVNLSPSPFYLGAADFNGDGKVNAKDVTALMKYIITPKG